MLHKPQQILFLHPMEKLNLPKQRTFTGPALVWKRVAAFAIDMLLLNIVVFFPFWSMLEKSVPKNVSFSESLKISSAELASSKSFTAIAFAMSILMILYFWILEAKTGQSIGKHAMKIYVEGDKGKPSSWQAFARSIVFVFPSLVWLVDFLAIFFTKTGQRLSEIISRTKVVEVYNLEEL